MLKKAAATLQSKLRTDQVFSSLLKGSGVVLLIQVLGRGVGYFDQVILARWMGVTDYGFYVYILSWATLVTLVPQLGQRDAVVRFIPEFQVKGDPGRLRGVVQGSLGMTALVSLGLAAIATSVALALHSRAPLAQLTAVLLGIWMMPLIALVELSMSVLQGFGLMAAAFAPLTLVRPVLVLVGAATTYLLVQRGTPLSATAALAITAAAFVVVLAQMLWMIGRQLRSTVGPAPAIFEPRPLLRVSLPLLLASGFTTVLLQSDIVMLGLMLGPREVGLYNAAARTVAVISFILVSVAAAAAPMIAASFAEGDIDKLQRLIRRGNQLVLLPSLAIVVAVIALSGPLLRNFGPEFVAMRWVLIILALGQFIKTTCGPVMLLLNLTGHQDDSARLRGRVATLNIGLNLVGILTLGPLGAALATTTSVVFERAYTDRIVVKRLGVTASWFSPLNRRLLGSTGAKL